MSVLDIVLTIIAVGSIIAIAYGLNLIHKEPELGGPAGFVSWLGMMIITLASATGIGSIIGLLL